MPPVSTMSAQTTGGATRERCVRAVRVEPRVEQRREGSRKMDPAEALELVARLRAPLQTSNADAQLHMFA